MADPSAVTGAPTTAAASESEAGEELLVVGDVLDRYDSALSRVAADPAAATTPGDHRLGAWFDVVTAESALTHDVLRPLRVDALTDGIVIEPGPTGLAWVHTPVAATALDGRIAFSWCGWSPGVERRVSDGAVTDDAVAISEGVGEVVLREGTWMLDELVEMDAEVHPPGTPDPCGTPT